MGLVSVASINKKEIISVKDVTIYTKNKFNGKITHHRAVEYIIFTVISIPDLILFCISNTELYITTKSQCITETRYCLTSFCQWILNSVSMNRE